MEQYDREADMRAWVMRYGSGAAARAAEYGMSWMSMAVYERLAFEVGAGAVFVQKSRLTVGPFLAQCDCQVTREMGWYQRVLQHRWSESKVFEGQEFSIEPVYFTLTEEEGKKEGAGFKVTGLTRPWFPKGRVLILQLALWDPQKKMWYDLKNPL